MANVARNHVADALRMLDTHALGSARGMVGEELFNRVVAPVAKDEVVTKCVETLSSSNDGGEEGIDKKVDTKGVTIIPMSPKETGFPAWDRGGQKRGHAEWFVPASWWSDSTWGEEKENRSDNSQEEASKTKKSAILFLHGGAYMYYSPSNMYRPFTSRLAIATGLPVFAIDYRLAPEHQFPAAFEDGMQALEWIWGHLPSREEGAENGIVDCQLDHVYIMGDSAGGGLAAAVLDGVLSDETKSRFVPHGMVNFSPWTDLSDSGRSYRSRLWDPQDSTGECVFLTETYTEFNSQSYIMDYIGSVSNVLSPHVSPIHSDSKKVLARLPPTLVIVGDAEVMLSDSVEYVARALEAGNKATMLRIYPYMWHVFPMYTEGCGHGTLLAAEMALREAGDFIRKLESNRLDELDFL